MTHRLVKMNSEALKTANSMASSNIRSIYGVAIRAASGQFVTVDFNKPEKAGRSVVERPSEESKERS